MHVIVDGLNFELPRGTGIKTYSNSLIHALSNGGNTVSVLSQACIPNVPYVDALSGYYATISAQTKRRRIKDRLIGVSKSLFGAYHKSCFKIGSTDIQRELGSAYASAWSNVDSVYSRPGVFDKSFIMAAAKLGGKRVRAKDADMAWLSSPVPLDFGNLPTVVTIHDLIPLTHPWLIDNWSKVARSFGASVEYAVKKADKIVCVSETTRRVLVGAFNVDERKLCVVHQPCKFEYMDLPEVCNDKNDAGEYILFLGALEPKKNLSILLDAVERDSSLPHLIVAGPVGWKCKKELKRLSTMGERVTYLEHVSDMDALRLMMNASAFVFPSLVEGFGLPVLEALWLGVPCVISDIEVFRELFEDVPVYVKPRDVNSVVEGVKEAIASTSMDRGSISGFAKAKFSKEKFEGEVSDIVNSM